MIDFLEGNKSFLIDMINHIFKRMEKDQLVVFKEDKRGLSGWFLESVERLKQYPLVHIQMTGTGSNTKYYIEH